MSLSLPAIDVDRRVAAALVGALTLVLVFRLTTYDAVFYPEAVVLSGNDPYFYLYWVEEAARAASSPFDVGVLSGIEFGLLKGEPLLVGVLWFVTMLAGGVEQAPLVLALYPVVAALVVGVLVYLLATGLTDDRRVGIASVVFLATIPVHALRSGVGFADHHAFDYVWLALTAAAAVRLARTPATREAVTARRTLAWAALAGVGVAGQVLAWEAGPLLLFPLALYLPLAGLLAVDEGRSPALALAPFGAALAVGSVLAAVPHLALGWQTDVVAYTPVLLLAGTAGVAALGEAVRRAPSLPEPLSPTRTMAAVEGVGTVAAVGVLVVGLPSYWARLTNQFGQLGTNSDIVEATSLFSTRTFGWLFLFGLLLAFMLPYLAWALARAVRGPEGERAGWLLLGCYTTVLLALATLQIRFAGELSPFVAVLSGLGFVHVAERVDLARPPLPFTDSRDAGSDSGGRAPVRSDGGDGPAFTVPGARGIAALVFLFLLLNGIGVAQTPAKASQITVSEDTYRTAAALDDYAAAHDIEYPENYVLSNWGRNRVYNYFVNGESQSYGYAFSTYDEVLRGTDLDVQYDRLEGRVGFVVLRPTESEAATVHARLYRGLGGFHEGHAGSGHYRAVRLGEQRAFHLVPGANVTGRAPANATVRLSTTVTATGTSANYTRRAVAGPDGRYTVAVANHGEYTVRTTDGSETVTVGESAVLDGGNVTAPPLPGSSGQ